MNRFVYPTKVFFSTMSYCSVLPYFVEGKVCKGFGRGSKELGIPTANFSYEVTEKVPKELDCGIYYGFARVNNGPIFKAVSSIGWNPYYQNDKKSLETHIMDKFEEDFYGANMKLVIIGHIRPERDFLSVDDLINEIKNDIRIADAKLDNNDVNKFRTDAFFQCNADSKNA